MHRFRADDRAGRGSSSALGGQDCSAARESAEHGLEATEWVRGIHSDTRAERANEPSTLWINDTARACRHPEREVIGAKEREAQVPGFQLVKGRQEGFVAMVTVGWVDRSEPSRANRAVGGHAGPTVDRAVDQRQAAIAVGDPDNAVLNLVGGLLQRPLVGEDARVIEEDDVRHRWLWPLEPARCLPGQGLHDIWRCGQESTQPCRAF